MTPEEAETAIRNQGVGWEPISQGVVLEADATPGCCNRIACVSYASAASAIGATAQELGVAVRAMVDGDDTLLRVILAG